MDLETIQANARSFLSDALKIISVRGVAERSGKAYGVAALMYHRLALCDMLTEARADRFQVQLCKSALTRLHLLRLAASGRAFHPLMVCASQSFSFADAVTAGQLDVAVELARLLPGQHDARHEYEDDFLLHRFMQKRLLRLQAGEDHDFQALLDRWERVVDGGPAPYLDACRALLLRNAEGFQDALLALIEERGRRFREEDKSPEDTRRTDGALFMNGLVLLRLAELSGMPTLREYPNIPHLARLPASKLVLPLDSWMRPDEGLPA